jgi:hypothetical protein
VVVSEEKKKSTNPEKIFGKDQKSLIQLGTAKSYT